MSSDADYSAFLDKANQDPGPQKEIQTSNVHGTKVSNDAKIPKVLQDIEEYFVSDTDEAFEPISIEWNKKALPTKDEFSELVKSNGDVSTLTHSDFDPNNQYKSVISAVERAGSGKVGFFRIQLDHTRAEYWVVCVDEGSSQLVGMKAIAVES